MDSLKSIKQEIEIADLNVRYYDDHIRLFQDIKEKSKSYAYTIPDCDYETTITEDMIHLFRAYEKLRMLLNKKFDLEDKDIRKTI